jgi:hypothetical protein
MVERKMRKDLVTKNRLRTKAIIMNIMEMVKNAGEISVIDVATRIGRSEGTVRAYARLIRQMDPRFKYSYWTLKWVE